MKIHRKIKPLALRPHLLIGNYDGVHLGHQNIIKQAKRIAQLDDGPIACLTFSPHPKIYFGQPHQPIQTPYDHWVTLSAYGISNLFLVQFDEVLANMPYQMFIDNILMQINPKSIHVGEDFKFGRNREGTIEHLKAHFNTFVTPLAQDANHTKYASSSIRAYLAEGNLNGAAAQLGRPFHISGIVQPGQQLGRKLGYPTANLHAASHPLSGIFYGTTILPDYRRIPSAISIGYRPYQPTAHGLLETHLIDFDEHLYGQRLHVIFHQKIRDQIAFDNMPELINQMDADVQLIRDLSKTRTTSC